MSSFPTLYGESFFFGRNHRCLAVLDVPPDFSLADTMRYFRLLSPWHGWKGIRRIIRTVEAGKHIYWIGFSSYFTARFFRNCMHGRYVPGFPPVRVEYIHGHVYSARASWARESWSRKTGLTSVLSGHQPPQPGISSQLHSEQLLPSSDFFDKPSVDDKRLFAKLADATMERDQLNDPLHYLRLARKRIASNEPLYIRLHVTTPPDDNTILTRRQRRDRERQRERETERDNEDGLSSPLDEDDHQEMVTDRTEM